MREEALNERCQIRHSFHVRPSQRTSRRWTANLINSGCSVLLNTLRQIKFRQDATLEPTVLYLILLQAALAWNPYRSCKRSNAEAAKAADSTDPGTTQTDGVTSRRDRNLQPMAEPGCSKKLKDISVFVIVGSGFALFAGATHFNMPRMGDWGISQTISPLWFFVWGRGVSPPASDCCERGVGPLSRYSSSAALSRSAVLSGLRLFRSCLTETCPVGLFFYSQRVLCW